MRNFLIDIVSWMRAHWKSLIILAGSVVGVIVLLNLVYYGVYRQPRSCTSCHYMDPYYEQWASSSHNEVTCVKCHPYSLGKFSVMTLKYWSGIYNPRPRAEVDDATCLQSGCHETRLLEGKILFTGDVEFSHKEHLGELKRGKRLRCTSCHSQIVQIAELSGQEGHTAVTKQTCFLCHFKGAKTGQSITGCPSCHTTPKQIIEHEGFSFGHRTYIDVGVSCNQCHLSVIRGEGDVPLRRCHDCHVERAEEYEDSNLIHDVHVAKHDIDCFKCHQAIEHGSVQFIQALEVKCENCHQRLHSIEKQMYMGVGGKGAKDTPSRMFSAQVSCDGCHTKLGGDGSQTFAFSNREAQRQSCVACHGQGYDKMLDDWIRVSKQMLRKFKPSLDAAKRTLARAQKKGRDLTKQEAWLAEAQYNFDFVTRGQAVHNVEYGVKLMKVATRKLEQVYKSLGVPASVPRGQLLGTQDGFCTILCHKRIGLPETLKYELMEFPHQLHASELEISCTNCHSPEKHKMQIITVSECMSCHHEQQDIDCGQCHPAQKGLYTGVVEATGVEPVPDIMAEVEVECVGCHDLSEEEGTTFEKVEAACDQCHEEGYREILVEWYNGIQEATTRVILLINDTEEMLKIAQPRTENIIKAKRLFEEAKQNYEIVDKGKGTHNPALSEELLQAAEERLKEAQQLLGKRTEAKAATSQNRSLNLP
jgi:nitrate/TMAO reductase-like tetraheme cytochrome c subunit